MAVRKRRRSRRPASRARTRRIGFGGVLLFVALAVAAVAALWVGSGMVLSRDGEVPPAATGGTANGSATGSPPISPVGVPAGTYATAPSEPEPSVPAPNGGPATPPPEPQPVAPGDEALVALVIDDLGRSLGDLETLAALGVPISYAVLPFESRTPEVAAALAGSGVEVLVHLPMEAAGGADPGPGTLRATMSTSELAAATRRALAAVPGAVGANNHMGSVLSADERAMRAVLGVLAENGLFFLDSRTSAETVAYRSAVALGVPAAERQVFLDPDPRPEAVRAQFHRLLALAHDRGAAIAIGHPLPATLAVLAEEVPRARDLGYRFVPVSYLLDRPGELP